MRQLKFSTPRIYAALIDNEADQQRDTKISDLINAVTVDSRKKVTRDNTGRPFILYNEKEWNGIWWELESDGSFWIFSGF